MIRADARSWHPARGARRASARTQPTGLRLLSLVLLSAFPVGVAGCGDGGDAARSRAEGGSVEVVDSAGIPIVRNGPGPGRLADTLRVTEVMRVGAVDAEGPFQFFRISDVVVADDGQVFVGNNQTGTVRVFTADGEFVHEFVGRGEGPGETLSVDDLIFAGPDRIAVVDWQAGGNLLLFTRAGELIDQWRARSVGGVRFTVTGWSGDAWYGSVSTGLPPAETSGPVYTVMADFRIRPVGSDLVAEPVVEVPAVQLYRGEAAEGGWDWGLFDRGAMSSAIGPDGLIYHSDGHRYRIRVFDDGGAMVRGVDRIVERTPLGEPDIQSYIEQVQLQADTLGRLGSGEGARSQYLATRMERVDLRASFPIPEFRPVTSTLLVSGDGGLWVERVDHLDPGERELWGISGGRRGRSPEWATIWDLFDPEGGFLGSARLPPRFHPRYVQGLRVTGVLQDELDVEYVVTYEAGPDSPLPNTADQGGF